jgi:AraC family transcriptional regulator, arabinose operon regulatory protein
MQARIETPYQPISGLVGDAFQRGPSYTNWRPKGTPDWLLIYTESGSGCITTSRGAFSTRTGDIILYSTNNPQDYKTDPVVGSWHLLWVHFIPRPSWHPWLLWPRGECGVRTLHLKKGEVRDSFAGALQRMIRISRRRLPNASDFAANALEEALLWAHVAAERGTWMHTDARVRQAMDYLVINLRQPFRLETLARHCGLSISRLAHLFKSEIGLSPQQFFEQQRMWHASQLLRVTGLSIAEVADEVGYEDPFYFSNRFSRYSGKSPTQFRRSKKAVWGVTR